MNCLQKLQAVAILLQRQIKKRVKDEKEKKNLHRFGLLKKKKKRMDGLICE